MGIVADNPDCKIKLKVFHSEIQNDHAAIAKEEVGYKSIPIIEKVNATDIQENYLRVKQDIRDLFEKELPKIKAKQPNEKKHVEEGETATGSTTMKRTIKKRASQKSIVQNKKESKDKGNERTVSM